MIASRRLQIGVQLPPGWREELPPRDPTAPWPHIVEHSVEEIVARWTGRIGTMAPPPVQSPHPPLWIAGAGEQRTLAVVARYANWANVAGSPDVVARKADVLRSHCERVGRKSDDVGLSVKLDVVIGRTDAGVSAQLDEAAASWRARGYEAYADTAVYRANHVV